MQAIIAARLNSITLAHCGGLIIAHFANRSDPSFGRAPRANLPSATQNNADAFAAETGVWRYFLRTSCSLACTFSVDTSAF